ncbi:hypothetical protein [Bacillus sp. FJAT-29814]|uniref:hypothetical protein n=1 Tax=Bacillus sp. FJAT-29814 TaxID=1729688 RepID=UPI0008322C5F|nr:hypothetical protein [Bacillus sp. FJAT-29814]
METKHQDSVEYYKYLEAETNKQIHSLTNCRNFTLAFGRALELHLKKVKVHKRLTTRWLKRLDLPNKDEIAAISVTLVDCEDQLDMLDETVYLISKEQHHNLQQLKTVTQSSKELLAVLQQEVKDIHNNKLMTLEEDLLELKKLFET